MAQHEGTPAGRAPGRATRDTARVATAPGRVRAVLGPTNTGKTHLAMERMLAHRSGMIGFPLRLLAREAYDRMVAAKGARHIALVTGEERIVPPEAAWFACTVEAMPVDLSCEFLAVDEIQLCADPDRGHVFTDRLLHARGRVETMVMGAETIRPLLGRLLPDLAIETRPRLSSLVHAGHAKLAKLAPRSAVVAFSAAEVYAIAEAIRRRHGGCAVVMGRLSPRTRNAQVALYQGGEVDYLVATDAIGMGLNMDVDHVAFAALRKFDGTRSRPLTAPEIAQIAGRAGRGMRDGTFGTTADCAPLGVSLAEQVEQHRFDPLELLAWRNHALDFASPDRLLASLAAPPPAAGLARGGEASDVETLALLARDGEIRSRAVGTRLTRLLWEACQVPDFRKISDDSHARLVARIFGMLADDGRLQPGWIESNLRALGRADGDIDTLMQRLAGVRVWTYVASRGDWTGAGTEAIGLAHEIEDRLSDALHERLTARFVDRRAASLSRRLAGADGARVLSAVTRAGDVIVEGHPVGRVAGFLFTPETGASGDVRKLLLRAARRALGDEMPHRVARLAAAGDAVFALQPDGIVSWEGEAVARLRAGRTVLAPLVEPLASEFLDGTGRERIRARLAAFVASTVASVLRPLFELERRVAGHPAFRGWLHALVEQGGVAIGTGPRDDGLPFGLASLGIRVGRFASWHPAMLKSRAMALRAILLGVATERVLEAPPPTRISIPAPPDPGLAAAIARLGFVAAGPLMVRLDVAERLAGELADLAARGPLPLPPDLASRLGIASASLGPVLAGLGIRVLPRVPSPPSTFGPPAPAMVARANPARRKRGLDAVPSPDPDRPFAALALLRRTA